MMQPSKHPQSHLPMRENHAKLKWEVQQRKIANSGSRWCMTPSWLILQSAEKARPKIKTYTQTSRQTAAEFCANIFAQSFSVELKKEDSEIRRKQRRTRPKRKINKN